MKQGKYSIDKINRNFYIIDKSSYGFKLYEHNELGEELTITVNENNMTYCYSQESLTYTTTHQNEFEWYKLAQ